MGKIRNKVALAGMGLLLAACGSTAAAAGTTTIKYPTRAVSLIVPVAAGSSLDIEARELAAILQQQFQWSIAVVDDPGASGAVGVAQVMSQPANGYTLLYEADGTMADLIAQKLIPYTFSDISPVVQFDGEAVGLITAANSPYKTVAALVAYAKTHPNALSVAATGQVGPNHEAFLALEKDAGITLKYIATNGGSETTTDTLNGTVNFGLVTPSAYLPEQKAGKLITVAVSADGTSYAPLPGVPTFESAGYDITGYSLKGIFAPKGTPASIIATIESVSAKVFASAAWKKYMANNDQLPDFLDTQAVIQHDQQQLALYQSLDAAGS
ncbi:MAG: tripartite tricarboxylate transporter substrate binding protein [Candidatus Dormibacteria bacterium]|jgi:tripartite-type tricarboxylate transporter receptor subunit TctC